MDSEFIKVETAGGICTITLNRAEKMNAITPAMHTALNDAFDCFAADPALQVCVVTGAGERAFCAGSDLSGFSADESRPYPAKGYAGLAQRFDLDKPVIAAVNGLCLGGGFELALACDMIIASDKAVFGLPEPKVGLIAIGGGIHRLVREIGLKRAMGPLLTGRNMSASEGHALGFVSEICPPGRLAETVAETCRLILANAPVAVRTTKALAMWGLDQPALADALAQQGAHDAYRAWRVSEDAQEGPKAFAAKRPPTWTGR
jgi:enoyl-CoA hydratase/carnithine racemase